MRIGIDTHWVERDGTGNCTYTRNLLDQLAAIDSENEYILYAIHAEHPFYLRFRNSANFAVRRMLSSKPPVRIALELAARSLVDHLDVLHVQYIAPPWFRGRLVLTVHDLAFLHVPDSFRPVERWRLRVMVPKNIARADRVLTVSEFSKQDIITHYGIPAERVVVTPNGGTPLPAPSDFASACTRHGVRPPFVVSVGRLDRRKNLTRTLDAFAAARRRSSLPHQLVLVGLDDTLSPELDERMHRAGLQESIVRTGLIPDQDLAALLKGADLMVYASLFEGFGLPVLEAMAVGCPVVTSRTSCLPEVAGDAAILVDPQDTEEIAAAIERVLTDATLRKDLSQRGRLRAARFSWRRTAERTLQVYLALARKHR